MAPLSLEDLPPSILRRISALLDLRSLRRFQAGSRTLRATISLCDLLLEAPRQRATWLHEAARLGDAAAAAASVKGSAADMNRREWLRSMHLSGEHGHRNVARALQLAPGVSAGDRVAALRQATLEGHRAVVEELAFALGVESTHREAAFLLAANNKQHDLVRDLWLSNWFDENEEAPAGLQWGQTSSTRLSPGSDPAIWTLSVELRVALRARAHRALLAMEAVQAL